MVHCVYGLRIEWLCHSLRCLTCSQLSEFHINWGHSKDSGSSACQEKVKGNRDVESDPDLAFFLQLRMITSSHRCFILIQKPLGVVFSKIMSGEGKWTSRSLLKFPSTNFSMASGNLIVVEIQQICHSLFTEWTLSGNKDDPDKISF